MQLASLCTKSIWSELHTIMSHHPSGTCKILLMIFLRIKKVKRKVNTKDKIRKRYIQNKKANEVLITMLSTLSISI